MKESFVCSKLPFLCNFRWYWEQLLLTYSFCNLQCLVQDCFRPNPVANCRNAEKCAAMEGLIICFPDCGILARGTKTASGVLQNVHYNWKHSMDMETPQVAYNCIHLHFWQIHLQINLLHCSETNKFMYIWSPAF